MRLSTYIGAIIVVCACAVPAQTDGPDGFVGVPWGATIEEIKDIMGGRGETTFYREQDAGPRAKEYTFHFGKFAYADVSLWRFLVDNDYGFYSATVVIDKRPEYTYIAEDFRRNLTDKYGDPDPETGDWIFYSPASAEPTVRISLTEFNDFIQLRYHNMRIPNMINGEELLNGDADAPHRDF
jgi:hypothetical protein